MSKRELSCFLCRELLYEYATDRVDVRRKDAVTNHLSECKECQQEHEALRLAMTYTKNLSAIEIKNEFLAEISNPTPLWRALVQRIGWTSWPDPLKWTLESLFVAGLVAVLVGLFGQQIFRMGTEGAREYEGFDSHTESIAIAELPDQTPSEYGDDEFTDHANDAELSTIVSNEKNNEKTSEPEQESAQKVVENKKMSDQKAGEPQKVLKGFLHRTRIKVTDVTGATDELIREIELLGGRKAGQVPLGWQRTNGSYFHFSMKEQNYDRLIESLKRFGAVNVIKESNPRVMPAGMFRMILELDAVESSSTPESSMPAEEVHDHE